MHHSDWLQSIKAKFPGHSFGNLPILDETELLKDLKENHITFEKNEQVPVATGVPPSVEHAKKLGEVFDVCTRLEHKIDDFGERLTSAVKDAIDEKVKAEGGVNMSILKDLLGELQESLSTDIQAVAASNIAQSAAVTGDGVSNLPQVDAGIAGTPTDHQFVFADANGSMKHWPVPESFEFSKGATLIDGWRVWLVGGVHFDEGGKPWKVKPYRELKGGDMKTKAMKDDLKKWRSVYSLMESAVTLPSDKADITQEVVLSTYQLAYTMLQNNFSYIFVGSDDAKLAKHKVGTWYRKTQRSELLKHGTDSDKAKLSAPGKLNAPHGQKRSFKVINRQAEVRIRWRSEVPVDERRWRLWMWWRLWMR